MNIPTFKRLFTHFQSIVTVCCFVQCAHSHSISLSLGLPLTRSPSLFPLCRRGRSDPIGHKDSNTETACIVNNKLGNTFGFVCGGVCDHSLVHSAHEPQSPRNTHLIQNCLLLKYVFFSLLFALLPSCSILSQSTQLYWFSKRPQFAFVFFKRRTYEWATQIRRRRRHCTSVFLFNKLFFSKNKK